MSGVVVQIVKSSCFQGGAKTPSPSMPLTSAPLHKKRAEMVNSGAMDRAFVTFEDVAIYFTRREWETLNEPQKCLYKEVMNDNYQMILSLNRPDIILNIDLGCEPYIQSHSDCTGSRQEKIREDRSSSQSCCTDIIRSRCEPQVKRQRRYPRVNPFRWIKKDKKKKRRFSRFSPRISRKAEDKKSLSRDNEVRTSLERRHCDSSTCVSQDSANNIQEQPIPDESFMNRDLNSEKESDDGTAAECSPHLEEAVSTCEKQDDVLQRSSLTRDERFTADTNNCEKPTEGSGLSPNLDCSLGEGDIHPELGGDTADSKGLPVSETSDILIKANSDSPSNMGTPKTETLNEERPPATKKKASHHKKDRHVKFNEVVTMFLIEKKSEERSNKHLEGGVKLQSTCLPIFKNINEEINKKKEKKFSTRHDIEKGKTSQSQGILHRSVEGTKQTRKRKIVSSSQAEEAESCHSDRTKCSKKKIEKGMGTPQRAPELEALSSPKKNKKERRELHSAEMNELRNFKDTCRPNMKSEDRKVDKGSGPQPNTPLSNPEQKRIKSYSCSSCGKLTHYSKLSIHQKASIKRSLAHMCRMCGLQTSSTLAAVPAQTINPPPFTTSPRSGEMSQAVNRSKKISTCSSAQPNAERILSAEKKQTPHSEQQKKPTKNSPSMLQKTQEDPHALLKKFSSYINNTKNPRCIVDHESPKSDNDCTKYGEGGEKNCVLRPNKKHKRPLEGMNPFQCEQCEKIFTCHLNLQQHRTVHIGERPCACKECGKSFQDDGYLKAHMRLHTKEKQKTLTGSSVNTSAADTPSLGLDTSCSRKSTKAKKEAFKSSVELPRKTGDGSEHEGIAKNGECFKTEQRNDPSCSDQQKKPTKSSPSTLQKTHDHHNAAVKTHSTYENNISNPTVVVDLENPKSDKHCTKCGKSLAKHVKVEDSSEGGEKNCILRLRKKRRRPLGGTEPLECKKCGKTFTRRFNLLQHRTLHTGERPYPCKECGKAFRDGGYLKAHMRLHTKEKPYTCSECGKCFAYNSALVVHLRTHTNERPYQCSVCRKSFRDNSTLHHHEMIHTGEKPFPCSFCGKKFTQQANVKRHEKIHTGERPFGCTVCEKRFIDRTKLRKHELIHNRGKVQGPKN